MAAHVTRMPVFRGTTSESWTSYSERLEVFFFQRQQDYRGRAEARSPTFLL